MERVTLSKDFSLSRLIYGMWRIGDDRDTTTTRVQAKIETCLEQGITSFDQADIYGGYAAEELLGKTIKASPQLRSQMEIVTKCGIVAPMGKYADVPVKYYDTSSAHINASVDASLKNMAIDEIDLLLIHRPDPFMDHGETGAALDALVKSGKIKNVGVSNFRPWDWELLQAGMKTKLVTNQIEISLGEPAPFTNGDLAFHQKNGEHVMAWSPLGGGALMREPSELKSLLEEIAKEQETEASAVAIAFLLAHPATILPIMGTNNLERIRRLHKACKVEIDRVTWFKLYQAAIGGEVA